jgi:hypothetical protein
MVKIWLGIANIQTQDWTPGLSIEEWWTMMECSPKPNRNAFASLITLVSTLDYLKRVYCESFQHNNNEPMAVL